MAVNNITDPGFENNSPAWQFRAGAVRKTVVDAHGGDWVAEVTLRQGFGDVAGRFGQTFSLFDTSQRQFSFAIRRTLAATPPASWVVHVEIYDGTQNIDSPDPGDLLSSTTFASDSSTDWVEFSSISVNPPTTTATIICRSEFIGGGVEIGTGRWELDTFDFPDPFEVLTVAKRRDILAAILARLATITTVGGFNTDVGDVIEGERKHSDIGNLPAIIVTYGQETKSVPRYHRKTANIDFALFLVCKETATKTGAQVADDLAEDVEKALEDKAISGDNQFLALGYIEDVVVTEITPVETTPEIHLDMRTWGVVVEVTYRHDRLSP